MYFVLDSDEFASGIFFFFSIDPVLRGFCGCVRWSVLLAESSFHLLLNYVIMNFNFNFSPI
jgi:hypothetical protein